MKPKKKVLFIVNPISGVGGQKRTIELIHQYVDTSFLQYDLVLTEHVGHATELSAKASLQAFDIVVAVGGDGTMNEVAQALIGTKTTLGIIPRGSGNGLARHLRIPTSVVPAIGVINNGKSFIIDTLQVNNRVCIGMAGIGFDGYVAHLFAKYGKRGLGSYGQIVLNEFKKYQPQHFEININGETINKELFLLSFANSSQFGNNAYIAPHANIQDGMMEICMLKRLPTHIVPVFMYRLFAKKAHRSKYLEFISAKEVSIKSNFTQMHVDGEPHLTNGISTHIKVLPKSLRVCVPNKKI